MSRPYGVLRNEFWIPAFAGMTEKRGDDGGMDSGFHRNEGKARE